MADNFNLKNFLFENKLGSYSRLKEEKFYAPNYIKQKYGDKAKEIEANIEDEEDNNPNIWDVYTSLETPEETDEFVQGFMNESENIEESSINIGSPYLSDLFQRKIKILQKLKFKSVNKNFGKFSVWEYTLPTGLTYRTQPHFNLYQVVDTSTEKEIKKFRTFKDFINDFDFNKLKKEDLKEYEVIYRVEDGRCYRITDEGYKDEVNMSYCRRFAEGIEENYFGQHYVDRMEGLANIQDLATLKTKLRILTSDWMQEGFEKEDIVEYLTYLVNEI